MIYVYNYYMELNYCRFGNGKKIMVILPGLSLKPLSGNLEPIESAYEIFKDDYTVYLFDYRDKQIENMSIEDMADDVYEMMIKLSLNDIYLYGVSLGGYASQILAYKHPDLIKKLALASSNIHCDNEPLFTQWYDLANENRISELVDSFSSHVFSENFYKQNISVIQDMYKDTSEKELDCFKEYLKAINDFDFRDKFADIKVPVFIMFGKNDKIFNYDDMLQIAKQHNYLYHCYENGCHCIYDEEIDSKEYIFDFYKD